ncbi:TetR/AcrR family transcriptional regulator [Puniceicoccaceae bacterium K14]|nr:TetR/AcrR family transcriptional regulator [Puniceicoccaceae bacterium K14]
MNSRATRESIVEAADELFYQQGFEHTSFAHIASAVKISRGNFYYHFKAKDEILDAVIDLRLAKTEAMLEKWEMEGEGPEDRILCFVHILIANWAKIEKHGCPVGTLSAELIKLDHVAKDEATRLFTLFRKWLAKQFEELGREADADELAMHLLARSQGVATLASAFRDEIFFKSEVERMRSWLASLV